MNIPAGSAKREVTGARELSTIAGRQDKPKTMRETHCHISTCQRPAIARLGFCVEHWPLVSVVMRRSIWLSFENPGEQARLIEEARELIENQKTREAGA